MDNAAGQEIETDAQDTGDEQDGTQGSQQEFLQEFIDALTPEDTNLLMNMLQDKVKQNRMTGTLDSGDEGTMTPMESGESDHMTEVGR